MNLFSKNISKEQSKDSGLALILISLIVVSLNNSIKLLILPILLLLLCMLVPNAFRPFGKVWFGLSHILGTIMSKLVLSLIFFAVVTPIGFIRRMCGSDPLKLQLWKKDSSSVFKIRKHKVSSTDIEKPY